GEEILFLARTPGFSTFAFVDNTNEEFSLGTHENTENVDGYVRLIQNYTQGRFTSRVFDAGGIAEWDNLVWSFVEPSQPASETDYVGAEPTILPDGSSQLGVLVENNYTATQAADGSYEVINEGSTGEGTAIVNYSYPDNLFVTEGGVVSSENLGLGKPDEAEGSTTEPDNRWAKLHENLTDRMWFAEQTGVLSTISTDDVMYLEYTFQCPAGDYLILGLGTINSTNTGEIAVSHLYIDGYVLGEAYWGPQATTDWINEAWIKKVSFSEGSHTVGISIASALGSYNVQIDNCAVLIWKLPTLYFYKEKEAATRDTGNVTALTFTAPQTDNYLILASVEFSAGTATDGTIALNIDGTSVKNITREIPVSGDYLPVAVMRVIELTAGDHTIAWNSPTTNLKRRMRIFAVPFGSIPWWGAHLDNYLDIPGVYPTWTTLLSLSFTAPYDGPYLAIGSLETYQDSVNTYTALSSNGVVYCQTRETPEEDRDETWSFFFRKVPMSAGSTYTASLLGAVDAVASDAYDLDLCTFYGACATTDITFYIYAMVGQDNYELQLKYYVAGDPETYDILLWNYGTGAWDVVGTLSSTTPDIFTLDLTGTAYILGTGEVRVRFRQGNPDLSISELWIDYLRVKNTDYVPAGQSLNWCYVITNVTSNYENYDLQVRGYSAGDTEYIMVYVWKQSTGSWEYTGYNLPVNTPSTFTYRLSPITDYLVGDNIYVKLGDQVPSDTVTTTCYIDLVVLSEAFMGVSDVRLQLRVSLDGLTWTDWMGPDGTPNTYFESNFTTMENIPDNRYIQYRVYFSTNTTLLTGANGPKVDWVRINASSLPNLIYPINVNINTSQPTFRWETVAADSYHLQIATDPGFTNLVVDNENIPGTENTWTPPNPLPDNHYWWRIQRYYNGAYYAWCGPENFRIDTLAPGPPGVVSPADGAVLNDNTPLLDWDPPDENSYPLLYQVWIAYDSSFL
ncbi:MAG: hypothetical protein QW356_09030, partial [Candidatus Hadarchaeales archaeon]